MKVIEIIEKDDGSANATVDLSEDELQSIIEIGFNKCLRDGMRTFENVFNTEPTEVSKQKKNTD